MDFKTVLKVKGFKVSADNNGPPNYHTGRELMNTPDACVSNYTGEQKLDKLFMNTEAITSLQRWTFQE